jgi:dTDP-4-amino-4,6-dideoxygalactose transaminase
LDAWNERRRSIAQTYCDYLDFTSIARQTVPTDAEPVWHLFVIRSLGRSQLISSLEKRGIETLIHYPIPPHRQEAYADGSRAIPPQVVAERLADQVLSLPMHPHQSYQSTRQVVDALAG